MVYQPRLIGLGASLGSPRTDITLGVETVYLHVSRTPSCPHTLVQGCVQVPECTT